MEPIVETKFGFEKLKVFSDRIQYTTGFFKKERTILASQIASIDSGMAAVPKIVIETTGGEKVKMIVPTKRKQEVLEAIYKIHSK